MTQIDRSTGIKGNAGMKLPCRAATTVAITLSGTQTVDGIALVQDDRCLVKDQASSVDNGIYVVDSGAWSRSQDCDGAYDLVEGTIVKVNHGSTNVDTYWSVTTTGAINPGTSALTFAISNNQITGATATGQALIFAASPAAARSTLSVPSNTEALLQTLADAKGDMILASGADAFVRKGAPSDGSVPVSAAAQTGGWSFVPSKQRTFAPNPYFQIDQRVNSATSRADDTYCVDSWYVLTQTAAIAVSQMSDQEDGQPFNVRLTQSQASAQRMGLACIIEGKDAKALRGKNMILQPRVRSSTGQTLRWAILEWTGTMDTVTSDVVNDWTSSTYTANNFFLAASVGIPTAPASQSVGPAAWTDLEGSVTSISSTANNLILFIWTESVAAQNVTLDIGKVKFVEGTYVGSIYVPTFSDELLRCQRYYWKTFPYTTAPVQNVAGNVGGIYGIAGKAGALGEFVPIVFPTVMRVAPAGTGYNPNATNAQLRDATASADCSGTAFSNVTDRGCGVTATGNASTAVGNVLAYHADFTADL